MTFEVPEVRAEITGKNLTQDSTVFQVLYHSVVAQEASLKTIVSLVSDCQEDLGQSNTCRSNTIFH